MKERIIKNLEKLKGEIKKNHMNFLDEAIQYIDESYDTSKRMIDADWLQKRILDDVYNLKTDGLVFTKINSYIHEYQNRSEQ